MKTKTIELCECRSRDPICTRCRKAQRLHKNWYWDRGMDGSPRWIKKQHVTKTQTEALRKLVEYFKTTTIDQIIDPKKVHKELAKISRKQLRANGFNTKGLTGDDCISLSMQHTRAFLGMDVPNVFTGVK